MAAVARSALRYSARHEAAASDSFADHVIAGLSDSPKWLSAKYFYDAAGSELFEEITRLDASQASRVMFLSGGAYTPVLQAFLARVPNERIQKPFDVAALKAKVNARLV